MNPVRNPYVPNAGAQPPVLTGREDLISAFTIALQRVMIGRTAKSLLPYGLRGVGKTVLLRRFIDDARGLGYLTALVEADPEVDFLTDFAEKVRRVLFELDTPARVNEYAKRAMRIFKSFTITAGLSGLSMNLGVDAERGLGDSGEISTDLATLLEALGTAAREQKTAVLIAIDEVQYLETRVFSALIRAIHNLTQQALPILIVAAGLPQVLALAGNAKSYAERLFDFRSIGPLGVEEALEAVIAPARTEGVVFEGDAAMVVVESTRGYPFFIQEWAYHAWNVASGESITVHDVRAGEREAIRNLDDGFFSVRYDRCTVTEKRYLRAIADFGAGPVKSADVAELLGKSASRFGPVRDGLIKKGMIWSPEHGAIAFTVPLFDEFMRRREPDFP